jgi:hypothetical protein
MVKEFEELEFRGGQAAPYSSRLHFQNQDTHTNIQTYIQKDMTDFNIDCKTESRNNNLFNAPAVVDW